MQLFGCANFYAKNILLLYAYPYSTFLPIWTRSLIEPDTEKTFRQVVRLKPGVKKYTWFLLTFKTKKGNKTHGIDHGLFVNNTTWEKWNFFFKGNTPYGK